MKITMTGIFDAINAGNDIIADEMYGVELVKIAGKETAFVTFDNTNTLFEITNEMTDEDLLNDVIIDAEQMKDAEPLEPWEF